jgi:hypothetical protein
MKRDLYNPKDKPWKLEKDERNRILVTTAEDLDRVEEMKALDEAAEKLEEIKREVSDFNNDRTDTTSPASDYR